MNQQVQVTIYEITRTDNGRPVCDRDSFKCDMQRTEKFQVIFEKWHKEKQPSRPLKDFDFLYYHRQSDQPDTSLSSVQSIGGGQGPNKGAQKIKPDQTPEQLHMPNKVNLYAKREDLDCECEEEPLA
ncbi:hypothetical protein IAT40_003713 [Kwoniella sp. CBS 6097]